MNNMVNPAHVPERPKKWVHRKKTAKYTQKDELKQVSKYNVTVEI